VYTDLLCLSYKMGCTFGGKRFAMWPDNIQRV
jgi:hypothetical protein